MTFKCYNLGCKVNLYEIEAITSLLTMAGYQEASGDSIDIIIVNTCTVTSNSDLKSRKLLKQLRNNYPQALLVAMGCFIQFNQNQVPEGIDILIGANNKSRIVDIINEYFKNHQPVSLVKQIDQYKTYDEMKLTSLSKHTRGFVKIQDGCENFCSYCAIPYARGKIKSRQAEDVVNEISNLVTLGAKEIVLAGINLGTYGQDLETTNLAKLIEQIVSEVPRLYRLRISSIELTEITDELLDVIKKHQRVVANHLHIPLQGGCDEILVKMNRRYNLADYRQKISLIRNLFDGIAVTTDFLAGFVGETQENFDDALAFIKEMNFADMHIFPYSRRKNTKADFMNGHLDRCIIEKRAKVLNQAAITMANGYRRSFLNETVEVLFEQKKQGFWYGHTSNYLQVKLASENNLENVVKKVKIIDVTESACLGQSEEV